ncbi:Protein Skeletor, isoforms B/C isoform X2 [Oopsacas minuta]|uniref:Protein Skeletor, isoforms B/C isoform X2 n=1 Tax=Oopsacas minuta TaxID=111878 RepID=A0AAV7KPM8_9METZ|nr:Protein Skeletor, isoforms B/C isoform X2 [Oopsacas minuta]
MKVLSLVLLLQIIYEGHAFYRLGTVGVGTTSGTIYLIDANTLFLKGFSANEAVVFRGGSGGNQVTATTNSALSNVNMMLDGDDDWLNVSPIEVRTASGDQLITSFDVPGNIQIPCSAEYLGKFSRNGASTYHSLAGDVFYDALNRRLFVAGLYLDGNAPAAYMWLDTNAIPTGSGVRAGYNGRYARVDDVNNQDTNVTLPIGGVHTGYRSLSVWCEAVSQSFGHISIPQSSDSFECSTTYGFVMLGNSPPTHGVSAKVYVLGPNTIGLKNLYFDGSAPATWYWAGSTSNVHDGFIVASEKGSLAALGTRNNANIVLTLPTDFDVCNSNFLGLYCVQASTSFGQVYFSTEYGCTNCPPICKTVTQTTAPSFQCQDLSSTDQLEYRYDPTNSMVTFRFHTCNLEANQYFAFGLSASSSGVAMAPNGDVVVCQYSTTGVVDCSDYDLTIRSQCALSGGSYNGACPDTVLTGGANNYINTQVESINALTTFTTTRAVTTTDSHDRDFTPGTPQYIIWARGGTFSSPTSERWVLRHATSERISVSSPIQIDYDSTSTCPQPLECPMSTPAPATPWEIPPLCINSMNSEIQASIGNTGGSQGYKAITGKDGWGIAWYLNDILIPEVYVLRGTTVTFHVNGGNDPADSARYHPLYITNSNEGGISALALAELTITETVLAGLGYNEVSETVSDLSVGPYCEWTETQGNGDNFNTFEEYKNTLVYSCGSSVTSGSFEWTPDSNTSDLVYYQCATHRLLGWKINVVNSLDTCYQMAGITTATTSTTGPITSTTELITSTTEPITSTTEPITSTTEPITSTTELITSTTELITSTTEPITSTTEPITSTTELITSTTELITSTTEPITSTTELITSTTKLITSTTEPITSTTEPITVPITTTTTEHETPTTKNVGPTATVFPWVIPPICIDSNDNTIKAAIGDSLDGSTVWYLNGLPAPEIYIKRGTEVTFYVNGGNNPSDPDNYHPLYLTSSTVGGILKVISEEKSLDEIIFAGLVDFGDNTFTIDGSLCTYTQARDEVQFQSFQNFLFTLVYNCSGDETGQFSWIPDAQTPDTIYYQCAQHENHGMKINVVDDLEECHTLLTLALNSSGHSLRPIFSLLAIAYFLVLYLNF